MLAAMILNAAQTLLIVLPLCVNACTCKEWLWPEICGLRGDVDAEIPRC